MIVRMSPDNSIAILIFSTVVSLFFSPLLKDALLNLMEEKLINQITVAQLTEDIYEKYSKVYEI